jgi:hypothetical protein
MKLTILSFLLLAALQIPKNDPTGIWQSASGTGYELHLKGSDLSVTLVPGSSTKYLKYEVNLKNAEEVNTYVGKGYFIAKLANEKECRFDTDWQVYVVTPTQIVGSTTQIIPVPGTCEIQEKSEIQLQLKKQ